MTEYNYKRLGAWAASTVGLTVRGRPIFGWGFENVRPGQVRLFTNHACTTSFVVTPVGASAVVGAETADGTEGDGT